LVSRHSFGEKQSAQQNLERFAKQQRNNAKAQVFIARVFTDQVFTALRSQKKKGRNCPALSQRTRCAPPSV